MDELIDNGILPWADLPYEEQPARKQRHVAAIFDREGLSAEVRPTVVSPRTVGARARVRLHGEGGKVGFHRKGSHELVEVTMERVARPEVVEAVRQVEALGGCPGEFELRSDGSRVVLVCQRFPPPLRAFPDLAVGNRTITGAGALQIGGLRVSPLSFYQVNLEVNARIVADVDALLQELAPTRLLDLYAGIGNLSAAAVRRGVPATLIEGDASSAADARHNLPKAEVVHQDVGRYTAGRWFFDVVVLDPPRVGAPGLLPKLLTTRPRALIYLSCDPQALARDLRGVVAAGYEISLIQPYDMFPDTPHVETLVLLRRKR